jgi:uridylate kinase
MAETPYKRVLLKLSGEMLTTPGTFGIETEAMSSVTGEIASVVSSGIELGIVIGGGNFLRGHQLQDNPHIERVTADTMGMLATTMNALALRDGLESVGVKAEVLGALVIEGVCKPGDIRRARKLLSRGVVVILAGGTGRPFFTTDTCAALRAAEIDADVLLKGTKVDGVYDKDPHVHDDAVRYDQLSYQQALAERLGVMDLTAFSMCMDQEIPIVVFKLEPGSLQAVLRGDDIGTRVE